MVEVAGPMVFTLTGSAPSIEGIDFIATVLRIGDIWRTALRLGTRYLVAPYQFPLWEQQPVLRIPVVGPWPFNTLVVVKCRFGVTANRYSDGKLLRRKIVVPTNFSLIGFDPRVPPPSQHSTSATLRR